MANIMNEIFPFKWFGKMLSPIAAIWICAFAIGLASANSNANFRRQGELFASVAFPVALAGWVISDARKRRKNLCYDYDSFIFFAWPIMLPAYLFRTRGWRALITLLSFAGICALASLIGVGISLLED
jgi:hypothetical protein